MAGRPFGEFERNIFALVPAGQDSTAVWAGEIRLVRFDDERRATCRAG